MALCGAKHAREQVWKEFTERFLNNKVLVSSRIKLYLMSLAKE